MHTAPLSISARACSGSGARCRYVNRIWPARSRLHSSGCGSLTLTIISASANTASASGAIVAPAAMYASSSRPIPPPASCSTTHRMAVRDEFAHRCGRQADAVFEYFDFLRDTDAHYRLSRRRQGTKITRSRRDSVKRCRGAPRRASGPPARRSAQKPAVAADHRQLDEFRAVVVGRRIGDIESADVEVPQGLQRRDKAFAGRAADRRGASLRRTPWPRCSLRGSRN